MSQVLFDYTRQDAKGESRVAHAWARVPASPTPGERATMKARAMALLAQHKAVLVAHYYVDGDLQDLALETGGCVADSLEMARFASVSQAWLAAAQQVDALELAGEEKSLAKAEGWLAARPWKKLAKEDGGWRLQTVLDHCRTLVDGFEKGAAAR